jgi:phage terminase small subunit
MFDRTMARNRVRKPVDSFFGLASGGPAMSIELRNNPLQGIELGPKLQACSERERIFAFAVATGIAETATEAARLAGYSDTAASRGIRVTAHHLLHRPRVVEAIEEVCRTQFRNLVPLVIAAAKRVLENPEHDDHVKMIVSLLSRLGYGEKTAVDVNVSGEIAVDHTTAAIDDLRRLKTLGLSRERLLEIFGYSGLDRYERLLAERDARAPKVIEHRADETSAPNGDADGR